MSLSDYIRYQRAAKGGLTPWEIAEGSGVSSRDVHLIEVKHRRMGDDDEMLRKLAAYFGVPFDALASRREAYRKRLAAFLDHNVSQAHAIALKLESGEELVGVPVWYSREAVALREGAAGAEAGADPVDLCIVQRGWVADWKLADAQAWEVATSARNDSTV
jgi:transcriptional regulator with XRE-family HTH domain